MARSLENDRVDFAYDLHKLLIKVLVTFMRKADATVGSLHSGLPPLALRVLDFVARHPGTSQRELVANIPLDKGLAARVIKSMETRGLITRSEDVNDRRSKLLELTSQGKELAKALRRAEAEVAATMFRHFSPMELDELQNALLRMERNLEG